MRSIERVSVIDQVVEELKAAVVSGTYEVGEKLPTEHALCEQLGVSRPTVREALRVLQAIGLVELRPGRGAFVARTSELDQASIASWFADNTPKLGELMEVRQAVEPLAVRLAARRRTARDLKRLRALHEQFEAAVAAQNASELALLDEEFHTAIVEAARNTLLAKIHRLVVTELRSYRGRAFAVPENAAHALEPHRQVLEAIEAQDPNEAMTHMTEHLDISMEDIASEVERAGDGAARPKR